MKKELQIHTRSQNFKSGKTIKTCLLALLFILSTAFFNQAKAQYCACVCTGYGSSIATYTFDEEILGVTLGTMSNPSNCGTTGPGGGSSNQRYSNYTGFITAPNFCQSQAVTFTCNVGTCGGWYGVGLNVYIDYNQNQLFTDAGELVYSNASAIQGNNVGTFTVAANALAGNTRIRFIAFEGTTVPGPTSTYPFGETEDYCINFPAPAIVAASGSVCPGANYVITPTGALTYTYASAGGTLTGTSVTVSPIANTVYTISATAANGCKANGAYTQTVSVTVNPLPTITVNSSSVCSGQPYVLIPSGAFTYSYTGGSATVVTTSTVSPSVVSNYSVTGTSAFGCISAAPAVSSETIFALPVITVNSGAICTGDQFVFLPAGPASNYTFVGTTNPVSPTVTTSYSVIGTSSIGCVSLPVVSTVTVNALPTLSISSSASVICAGTSVNMTASGATTYTWNGTATGSTLASTPSITSAFLVIGTDANGCKGFANSQVTVNPLPVLTLAATNTFICLGNSATLTTSGALSYTWTTGSNTTNVVVTPTASASFGVSGTNTFGCVKTSTVAITVNSIVVSVSSNNAVISNSTAVCDGNTTDLTASGATTYTWVNNNSHFAGIYVSPAALTVYTVNSIDAKNCKHSNVITVAVNPNPVVIASASRSTICTGETTTLTASGASTYSWLPNGSGGSSLVINGVIAGNLTYVVTGYDSKGCSNDSTVSVNVSKCTGIASIANSGSGVKVYPNPNAGEFTVELDNGLNKSIEVTDLTGRVILVSTTKEDKATINISTFAKGVYYVKVQSNNSVEVIKVIKQ